MEIAVLLAWELNSAEINSNVYDITFWLLFGRPLPFFWCLLEFFGVSLGLSGLSLGAFRSLL